MSDLHQFRKAIVALCERDDRAQAVLVPTHGAAAQLRRTFAASGVPQLFAPDFVTRDGLYDALHARLDRPPRRLTAFERDALAQAAATEAASLAGDLPFRIRPGLVAELLHFYDQLRRQSQQVNRFEELLTDALGGAGHDEEAIDRGSARLLRQTRFLAESFRGYERRVADSGACDEHTLRARLVAEQPTDGLQHLVVTVPDWIADPAGLFVADFDLLSRVPGVEVLDLVCTESILGSGFHERIHSWWPGLEEVEAAAILGSGPRIRPTLSVPSAATPDRWWFTHRDREEELLAVAARASEGDGHKAWDRFAIVFKRPLPYLYLAPQTLGAAKIPYLAVDALPLAAEPAVAIVDLVLDAVETRFTREALIALLRCPHFDFSTETGAPSRESIARLNQDLAARRFLGGLDRLLAFDGEGESGAALRASQALGTELATLLEPANASQQLRRLIAFIDGHLKPLDPADPLAAREQLARAAALDVLTGMADAHAAHHDPVWAIDDLSAAVRRAIAEQTFPIAGAAGGVNLLDDQAARYGDFDDLTIVGLIEGEWPEAARRNIFYPSGLLKALGWPSEKDRRAAAGSRFLDLLTSASARVELSTITLDDEALVTRSILLDEVPRARLSAVSRESSARPPDVSEDGPWANLRRDRPAAESPGFHGSTGALPHQSWSVSALETYLSCPFKFFAQHVLRLEEEPDDEEVMDPRRQGQFVHEVFAAFFEEWQAAGHREIKADNLPIARELFVRVVDRALEKLPEGEAGLERTRLLGSSAAAGLGEAVFRMEAERDVPVVERRLEHSLSGRYPIATSGGQRTVDLRGKADRIDLLADGTFRVIDYKLGWPPDKSRALQLPIYGLCAEQRLAGHLGRTWTLGEAVYLAFKGPKRVVPLFANAAARDEVVAKAQQRLGDIIDAIERGEFPPTPDDVFRCDTCSYASVCRKDYVGDV